MSEILRIPPVCREQGITVRYLLPCPSSTDSEIVVPCPAGTDAQILWYQEPRARSRARMWRSWWCRRCGTKTWYAPTRSSYERVAVCAYK
eukprot:2788614-Rhodomonas_salina.2